MHEFNRRSLRCVFQVHRNVIDHCLTNCRGGDFVTNLHATILAKLQHSTFYEEYKEEIDTYNLNVSF